MSFYRLTHSGKNIAALESRFDVWREILQEAVEAIVFMCLCGVMMAKEPDEAIGVALFVSANLSGLLLLGFFLNRVAVIVQLFSRLVEIDNREAR